MSDLRFEVSSNETDNLHFTPQGTEQQTADVSVRQINDTLLALVERCIARAFSEEESYSKYQYVINGHTVFQFITDHAAGPWNSNEVRMLPLAEDLQLLFDALTTEVTVISSERFLASRASYNQAIADGAGVVPEDSVVFTAEEGGGKYYFYTSNEEETRWVDFYGSYTDPAGVEQTYHERKAALSGAMFQLPEGSDFLITVSTNVEDEDLTHSFVCMRELSELAYIATKADKQFTVLGEGNQSLGQNTLVFGRYAASDVQEAAVGEEEPESNLIEAVGNGSGQTSRHNARTLDWQGNETLAGKLTVGAGPSAAMDVATKAYVDASFAVNDAMIFKGTLGTGGTVTALPAVHSIGWTYRVITAGTYAGQQCENGDLIICRADGTTANNAHWTVVQANIDGAVTGPASAVGDRLAAFSGTSGKVVKDSGIGLSDVATKGYADAKIDDTAGDGVTGKTWSADKLMDECFCVETGVISSLPKVITDARVDASCIVEDKILDDQVSIGWVTVDGKLILYGRLDSGVTLPSKKISIKRCHGLTGDAVTLGLRFQASSNENGNYLVATGENLIPTVQYTWRLYTSDGTQVYAVGTVPSSPTYSMWFQEAVRGLVNGDYYCTIAPTLNSSNLATSGTVTFTKALTA